MDGSRVYRIGGRPYHRGNFMPSATTTRQTLEERLHSRGISTSSNSSWTYSNSHLELPKQRQGRVCGSVLIAAVFVVASAVLTIGGLAFYLGAVKVEPANYIFDGSLRITYGDQYQSPLANTSSKLFHEKSLKYGEMIATVLQKTVLNPAVKDVHVFHFQNGSLIISFRIHLDRRKLPDVDAEEVIRSALLEEFGSVKPVAFRNIQVDPRSLSIIRHSTENNSIHSEEAKGIDKNGVIRKLPGTTAKPNMDASTEKRPVLIPVTGTSVKIDSLGETIQLRNKPNNSEFTSKEGIVTNHSKIYQSVNITSVSMTVSNRTEKPAATTTTATATSTTTTTPTTTSTHQPTTNRDINGHARPLVPAPVNVGYVLSSSADEEPWRPILPSKPAVVQPMPSSVDYDSIVTAEVYKEEKPITFSKEVYEQNLKILPEFNGKKVIKNTKLSRIAEEIAKKYKDLLKHQPLKLETETETSTEPEKTTISNPFVEADDSRSSSILNFDLPELPLLKQFHHLDSLFKSFNDGDGSPTPIATTTTTVTPPKPTAATTTSSTSTEITKTTAAAPTTTVSANSSATRFPTRRRTSTMMPRNDDTIFVEVSTVAPRKTFPTTSTTSATTTTTIIKKSSADALDIKGEVEVLDSSSTSDAPVLVTLLPVRSNVNMKSPLRPRPLSERKGKVRREFSPQHHFVDDEGGKRWVYYSSSRITTETPKNIFIVTPETQRSEVTNSPIYNTIESLLNTDFRERHPLSQNYSKPIKKIVEGLDNVALAIGSSSDVIIKINGSAHHDDQIGISTKAIASGYKFNQAGLPILTKLLNKDPNFGKPAVRNPLNEGIISSHLPSTACDNTTIQCTNGLCLPASSRCNQLVDCPDALDEKNCTCAEHLKAQRLNRKICDGIVDCWDFSDEYNCEWCQGNQYLCRGSRKCIDINKTCDGIAQCPEGDDESKCVTIAPPDFLEAPNLLKHLYHISGNLLVRKHGEWGFFCVQDFEQVSRDSKTGWKFSDLGRSICKALTYRDFEKVETMAYTPTEKRSHEMKIERFYELSFQNSQEDARATTLSFSQTNCTKRQVLKVTCKDLECGLRPQVASQWSRIVGGSNSSPGAWPWQAALYKEGEFQCGATLITSQWLVSAGHCFFHNEGKHWVARLGTLRTSSSLPSPYEQIREIIDVILHPKYVDAGFINDIALLRLAEPVQLTDYIRPICLPRATATIIDGTVCTVVGWGQLFEIGRIFPDTLQEVQLPLISSEECRKRTLFFPLYNISDDMFCAGYERGGRDACLGDSGGPLMCQEPDGRWTLYGVTSKGLGCARSNRPGVYTKVSRYLHWIQNQIQQRSEQHGKMSRNVCKGHRCPLGECLPKNRLCNGFVECSDGSDERDCW